MTGSIGPQQFGGAFKGTYASPVATGQQSYSGSLNRSLGQSPFTNGSLLQTPNYMLQNGGGSNYSPTSSGYGSSTGYGSSGGSQQYYGGQQNYGGGSQPNSQGNVGTFNNINQPQSVYTPEQTQYAVNQAVADARSQANPRWQEKQFQTAGRSTDAGTLSAAAPQIGSQLENANAAMGMLPLQDYITNQNNLLGGQINQDNESLGQSQLLGNMALNNQGNALGWLSTFTGPLMGSLLG